MTILHILSGLLIFILPCNCNNISEIQLRETLFSGYDKNIIPSLNNTDGILLKFGLEINNLVYFNQKSENIELTMRNILLWKDFYLNWDDGPEYIMVKKERLWIPDLELYNSASKPKLYDKSPMVKLYRDGEIEYVRVISYSFSCKLTLDEFPFDTQTCNMLFGSWKYSKKNLDIRPFGVNDHFSNFSVSPLFSHNEWNIAEIDVLHKDYEYKCCPGDLWPNSKYILKLKRNPHKYNLLIIMAVFITISSLFINYIDISIYYRTYILVFIPLTLIWLQIHTSSKIPVISYTTKLERIISTCFLTTMFALFESGILYSIIGNHFVFLSDYIEINSKNKGEMGKHIDGTEIILKPTTNTNFDYPYVKYIFYKLDRFYSVILTSVFIITILIIIL
jgi:hypothetical protein